MLTCEYILEPHVENTQEGHTLNIQQELIKQEVTLILNH
jgi:hypothetical protein